MSIEKEYLARESDIDDYDAYISDAQMFKQHSKEFLGWMQCGTMPVIVEPTIVWDADKLIDSFTNGSISEDTYKKELLLIQPDTEEEIK